MSYLALPGRGSFPCLFRKLSFASSINSFHTFSQTMGGRSYLRFYSNLFLYWALVYFKLFPTKCVTTFFFECISKQVYYMAYQFIFQIAILAIPTCANGGAKMIQCIVIQVPIGYIISCKNIMIINLK